MFDVTTGTINTNPMSWVDLGISVVLIFLVMFTFFKLFKNKTTLIFEIVLSLVLILSWFFNLTFLWYISILALTCFVIIMFLANQKEFKKLHAKLFSVRKRFVAEKVYDRNEVCQKISIAVEGLSKSKVGALITFERNDKFNDIVKSGTILNSPINPELLSTIFYPGTRLHDGAVVIRRDEILAASVYYTPTTKPLTGKYGSRHRAAIGISEITDSITVVVSEETGRISIAHKGELIPVAQDKFLNTLLEYFEE